MRQQAASKRSVSPSMKGRTRNWPARWWAACRRNRAERSRCRASPRAAGSGRRAWARRTRTAPVRRARSRRAGSRTRRSDRPKNITPKRGWLQVEAGRREAIRLGVRGHEACRDAFGACTFAGERDHRLGNVDAEAIAEGVARGACEAAQRERGRAGAAADVRHAARCVDRGGLREPLRGRAGWRATTHCAGASRLEVKRLQASAASWRRSTSAQFTTL